MDIIKLFVEVLLDGGKFTWGGAEIERREYLVFKPTRAYRVMEMRGVVRASYDGGERKEVVHSTQWLRAVTIGELEKAYARLDAWVERMEAAVRQAQAVYSAQKPKRGRRHYRRSVEQLAADLGWLPERGSTGWNPGYFLAKHGEEIIAEALAQSLISKGEARKLRNKLAAEIEYHFTGRPYWRSNSTKVDRRLQHRRARRAVKRALARGDWEAAEFAGEDILREYLD